MIRTRRRVPAAPPRRRRRRLLPRLVAGFMAAVLIGACGAAGLVHWGVAKIDQTAVRGLIGHDAVAEPIASTATTPELLNVLLVGNDSREGLSREQIRDFGTGQAEGNRTDTIMLLQLEVNGDGGGAVLSFPRDLLVTRCDGSRGRINAAYGLGATTEGDGPSCLVETVSDLTGVTINHYVEVSFAGFLEVVDALGGVGLFLDEPISDEKAHIDLPAGCVRLEGGDALGFVRARHLDSDFGRIARQQRFIKEMVREATDVGILANPAKLLRIVDAAAASVHTDDGLDPEQMRTIAMGLRGLTADRLAVYTVPGEAALTDGTWYVIQDDREAKRLFADFRTGDIVRRPVPKEQASTKPALPAVTVLNAADGNGLAAAAAEVVEGAGFTVAEVGNAELGGLTRTRILHPPQLAEAAAKLAALFPGADVIQGVDSLPLTLKLGADVDAGELNELAVAGERPGHKADKPTEAPAPTFSGATMTDVDC